jgi:hypothetical protein
MRGGGRSLSFRGEERRFASELIFALLLLLKQEHFSAVLSPLHGDSVVERDYLGIGEVIFQVVEHAGDEAVVEAKA